MKAEEKEQARAERERLREEQRALRELREKQAALLKEQAHYQNLLASATPGSDEAAAAEEKLAEVADALEGVTARQANTRAGYVYVVSNIGSFGEGTVKIGMTRRLDPMERMRELSDASVPFQLRRTRPLLLR